jgi:hypothetical protein
MSIYKINNVFTDQELELLNKAVTDESREIGIHLGRMHFVTHTPPEIMQRLEYLVKKNTGEKNVVLSYGDCVEYSGKYGIPDLPPHFDGDTSDLIIDFQLSSNTSWDLGVNLKTYTLEDNSAVIFNPNTNIHWRPIKEFSDEEFVRLLFFRCVLPDKAVDYSNKILSQDDPIFDEARHLRNTLAGTVE